MPPLEADERSNGLGMEAAPAVFPPVQAAVDRRCARVSELMAAGIKGSSGSTRDVHQNRTNAHKEWIPPFSVRPTAAYGIAKQKIEEDCAEGASP